MSPCNIAQEPRLLIKLVITQGQSQLFTIVSIRLCLPSLLHIYFQWKFYYLHIPAPTEKNLLPHRFNFHGNSDHYTSRYSNLKPCFWYLTGAFTFCPMVFRSLPSTPIQDEIQKHLCHTYAPITILKDYGRQTLLSPQTLEGKSHSLLCLWEALISINLSPLFWRLDSNNPASYNHS